MAADPTYAPNEFIGTDGKTVEGMDPDLAKALGRVLGLDDEVVTAGFDTIIPGLQSGKYDLGMSSFTDTKARPDQNAANLAISSGRAEVGMTDSPVAAYIVKQSDGQFELTGEPYNTAPYGIAVPKDSGLAQPVLDALKELMAGGGYASILTHWGVQEGAISSPQLNGAVS